ncbi:MAG: YbfB/YjiJ family MFS transporter [Deltaproteobacteria bacterium]|nr:MAG: YbfB/YjiJ family MFS transporter [Deltaproteobacteria bacterium]
MTRARTMTRAAIARPIFWRREADVAAIRDGSVEDVVGVRRGVNRTEDETDREADAGADRDVALPVAPVAVAVVGDVVPVEHHAAAHCRASDGAADGVAGDDAHRGRTGLYFDHFRVESVSAGDLVGGLGVGHGTSGERQSEGKCGSQNDRLRHGGSPGRRPRKIGPAFKACNRTAVVRGARTLVPRASPSRYGARMRDGALARAGAPPASMWVAAALALGPAVSNGIGRFAYALVLPAMRSDLHWTYTEAGWVNTANALGYLAGALATLRLLRGVRLQGLFAAAMVVTTAAIFASGLSRSYPLLLSLRFVAGLSGAVVFIGGGTLVAELFAARPERAPAAISVYFAGGGFGILLSGIPLPWLFELRGPAAWNLAWIGLGTLCAALCIPSVASALRVQGAPAARKPARWSRRPLLASLVGYFVFAIGSIVYMTFIVAWMRDRGAGAAAVSTVWGVLGIAIVLAVVPAKMALERWGAARTLTASIAVCTIGAALPLASTSLGSMVLSAALFGAGFFIPPAAVTALSQRALPREAWGSGVATYTVCFAAGQPIGPALAGAVADATGTLFAGLLTAVAVLVACCAIAALQKEP